MDFPVSVALLVFTLQVMTQSMATQTTSSITTSTRISSTTTAETTTTETTTAETTTAATTTAATTTAIEKTTTADTSATTNDTSHNTTGTDSTDTTNHTSTTTTTTTTTDDPDTDSATTLWNTPGPLNNTTEHSDHSTTSETRRKLPADIVGGVVGGVGFIMIGLVVVVMVQCYFISRYVIRKNPIYACPRNLPLQSQESFHCIDDLDDMADYATIDDESDEAEPIGIKEQVKLTKNPSYSSLSLSATYLAHINSRLAQSTPNLASTGSKPVKLAHSASNLVLSYHAHPYNNTSELTDASSRGGYTTSHESSSRGGLATTVAKREDLEGSYEHEYY